jgi:hypothetical protein
MKKILLPNTGLFALVDDEDFDRLSKLRWRAEKHYKTWYVLSSERVSPVKVLHVTLHNVIMGIPPVSGLTPDHKDRDGLNNQKSNLRWATASEQRMNTSIASNNTSGYRGVYFARDKPRKSPWKSRIEPHGEAITLGYFETKEEAALAYNVAAVEIFGEFATLNVIR